MEVARRQMEEAIHLFFEYRDTISIHTLIAAAHEVLVDVCNKEGISHLVKDKIESSIKEEERSGYRKSIRTAQNFFKHAKNDPDGVIDFNPKQTEMLIYDAGYMYGALSGVVTPPVLVYRLWFLSNYPDFLEGYPDPGEFNGARRFDGETSVQYLGRVMRKTFNPDKRQKFLKMIPRVKAGPTQTPESGALYGKKPKIPKA